MIEKFSRIISLDHIYVAVGEAPLLKHRHKFLKQIHVSVSSACFEVLPAAFLVDCKTNIPADTSFWECEGLQVWDNIIKDIGFILIIIYKYLI